MDAKAAGESLLSRQPQQLCNFLRRPKLAAIYDGTKIKRLLHGETLDWSPRDH